MTIQIVSPDILQNKRITTYINSWKRLLKEDLDWVDQLLLKFKCQLKELLITWNVQDIRLIET
jgi:hypothetical protein